MGLDMYLERHTYVKNWYVKNWEHSLSEERHEITVLRGGLTRPDVKPERITYIIEEVGYWRKFNALHSWFVENAAGGVDDCREVYISKDLFRELLDILQRVNQDHESAPDLLPTQEGFFFGSYDYDDWYFESVEESIPIIEEALADTEADYYYRASW